MLFIFAELQGEGVYDLPFQCQAWDAETRIQASYV